MSAAFRAGGSGLVRVRLWTRPLWWRRFGTEAICGRSQDRRCSPVESRRDSRRHVELALDLYRALLVPSIHVRLGVGCRDPVRMGEVAACIYGAAGMLAPFAQSAVALDWSGRSQLDLDVEIAFRIVLAGAVFEICRGLWRRHKTCVSGESTS